MRLSTPQVKEVLAKGKGRRGTTLSLKMLANSSPFRCSAIVSKKVARTAVGRNRLRRAVYQALRGASLPRTGHAILFVQAVPPKDAGAVFAQDIKKLLHV